MVLIIRIIMMCLNLILVPAIIGAVFFPVGKGGNRFLFGWVGGQVLLWAGFELMCVPLVLMQRRFEQLQVGFLLYIFALLFFSMGFCLRRRCKGAVSYYIPQGKNLPGLKKLSVLWIVFAVLLVLQLFLLVFLAYEEGDDAYYVAISTISMDSNQMYMKQPYTGGTTSLDVRHALAPFPIWITFLAKIFSIPPVTVAHVALPLVMLPMAYGIFYLLGERLLENRKQSLPYFMVLTELLVLYGGYSVYSSENFLLVRGAQGKAVLGNIVIPFLILLLYILLDRLHKKENIGIGYFILMAALMTAGCLCSTLGTFLLCMITGITAMCAVVAYRKIMFLIPLAFCMMIPVTFAGLYFWLA